MMHLYDAVLKHPCYSTTLMRFCD